MYYLISGMIEASSTYKSLFVPTSSDFYELSYDKFLRSLAALMKLDGFRIILSVSDPL